jgi:hypothetical protein
LISAFLLGGHYNTWSERQPIERLNLQRSLPLVYRSSAAPREFINFILGGTGTMTQLLS